MQKPQVRSLGGEDPLEEKMATHSSILAWETPCMDRGTWRLIVHRVSKSRTRLNTQVLQWGHTLIEKTQRLEPSEAVSGSI